MRIVEAVLARRLLILAIVLLLVSAVAASLAPRQVAPALPPSSSLPAGDTVTRSIPAAAGADTQVRVARGDVLELEVEGDVLDTVLLEQLDRLDGITPESPARFNVLIDAPAGYYPIRLVDADRRIGGIQVTG